MMPGLKGLVASVGLVCSAQAVAQQADPEDSPDDPALPEPWIEWTFGLRAITSVGTTVHEADGTKTAFDISDSQLSASPRVPLTVSRELRAGALFTLTFPDAYEQPGAMFVGDANMFIENRWALFRLGRGRLTSHIVPAAALRDDDLIRFAEVQNPFSDGESSADHQYGNVANLTVWPTARVYADVHAENLSNNVLAAPTLAAYDLNSAGMTLGYRQLPSMTTLSVVRQVGVGANAYHVDLAEQKWTYDLLAGGWFNLVPHPVHTIDSRTQVAVATGVPGADPMTPTGSFRARSISGFTSIGYTYRRRLLPTLRANVAAGYRTYLEADADQLSALGNVFWALSPIVEVGAQYQYRKADADLPRIFGEDQVHSVKLCLVGTFRTVANPIFDDRASILNTENGYLP